MKAIILAAGEGMRMRPLTIDTPKPLLKVVGKPLLEHIFEALPPEIDEVNIVVKYLGDKIKRHCGSFFYGKRIVYTDGSYRGTAYSFLSAKSSIDANERFLFVYGDELPNKEDIKNCLSYPASILCFKMPDPWNHGVAEIREDGTIVEIEEKPKQPKSYIVANGVMVLTGNIFEVEPEDKGMGEIYFTDMLNKFVKNEKVNTVISEEGFGGISTPDDIEKAEKFLLKKLK